MLILSQLLIILLLFIGTPKNQQALKINQHLLNTNISTRQNVNNNNHIQNTMGISINLYRVGKAEKLSELKDLEKQIAKTADTRVDLYKITSDLAVIFLNTTDPYSNTNTIPYKMLFGKHAEQSVSVGEIGGFLPSSEILEITKWIKTNKVETFNGFSKMYDNLSKEVKKELEEMGSDDKVSLFNAYVRPLVVLYFTALENQNSVLFIGQ
jgi:thioredoxin-related protein